MVGIPSTMVVIVVKESDGDGAVVVVEEDCDGSEGGVSGGVGVWKGPCDKTGLELEDAGGGEDGGDVVDGEVSDDDVSCDDVGFGEELEFE